MNHALRVCRRQAVGHVGGQLDRVAPRHLTAPETRAQRLSLEQFDHRHRLAVDDGELVDGHDVGVRDGRNRARLVFEAGAHLPVGRQMVGQHLQRDVTAEPRVARAIDLTHSSGADGRYHFELRETRAWPQTHSRILRGAPINST